MTFEDKFEDRDAKLRGVFRRWWQGLTDAANGGGLRQRGALARLRRIDLIETNGRRAPDVIAALMEEPFRELIKAVQPYHDLRQMQDERIEDLVTAAVTLARLRQDVRYRTTAQLLGGKKDEDRVMKEGRFLALMRSDTPADLFDQARRLPPLLNNEAPVGELGTSLLLWRTTPSVRRDWARDYYHLDLGGRERRTPETSGPAPAAAGA